MKRSKGMIANDKLVFFLFLFPALFAFTMVVLIPFFMGLYYSFTNWNGAIQKEISFVGLANFSTIFTEPSFVHAFIVTSVYTVMSVVLVGGEVKPGDSIVVELPPEPHKPLEVV